MTNLTERDDLLDFPGADELIAAGVVAPPAEDRITAVRDVLALLAERETEQTHAPAHDVVVSGAVARRGGPKTALAPPEDTLVVMAGGEPSWTAARPSRPSGRRRVLIAAAAVAAMVTGAVVYPVLDTGGTKPAATVSAAEAFLNDMADVAAGTPETTHAKYWKVRFEAVKMGTKSTQLWYVDRQSRTWWVNTEGKVEGPWSGTTWKVSKHYLTWADLDKLPTDQKALARLFPKDHKTRFAQVTELLGGSPASPRLRSALFRMLADIHGVQLSPGGKDSKGRRGTLISFTFAEKGAKGDRYAPFRYVIDPKTGQLLEYTSPAYRGLENRTTWLEVGPANRIS